jgi:hypothetical protein
MLGRTNCAQPTKRLKKLLLVVTKLFYSPDNYSIVFDETWRLGEALEEPPAKPNMDMPSVKIKNQPFNR